jgi:DnaK suppressor protein
MSRKDALVRLHARLVAQRNSLREKISDEMGLAYLQDDGTNDIGETASQVERSELHTQLAALESRELEEIEHAIAMIREGRYGACERCQKAIPVARLQALPFAVTCVDCQRRAEASGTAEEVLENWAGAMEYESRALDAEPELQEFEEVES